MTVGRRGATTGRSLVGPRALRRQPRTLITGATGFLGSHLIRELLRRGEGPLRLLQTGSGPTGQPEGDVEVIRGSVINPADVAAAVSGVERIYHLAGLVSQRPTDAHRMYDVHVNGTRVLAQAAVAAGVRRVVMASTSGTIAVSRHPDAGLDESSPAPVDLIARWPYYASKLYQEQVARRTFADKVELVMLNPSLLLGPGDDRLSSTRVVMQFLGRELPLTPGGGLNFVDARDVAAVFPVAMERGRPGERYLLGGYNWTFEEFFGRLERLTKVPAPLLKSRGALPLLVTRARAAILRHWGRDPAIEPASVDMAEHYWYFESDKAARELGFAAREATETLFDTVAYLRSQFLGRGSSQSPPVISRPDLVGA